MRSNDDHARIAACADAAPETLLRRFDAVSEAERRGEASATSRAALMMDHRRFLFAAAGCMSRQ